MKVKKSRAYLQVIVGSLLGMGLGFAVVAALQQSAVEGPEPTNVFAACVLNEDGECPGCRQCRETTGCANCDRFFTYNSAAWLDCRTTHNCTQCNSICQGACSILEEWCTSDATCCGGQNLKCDIPSGQAIGTCEAECGNSGDICLLGTGGCCGSLVCNAGAGSNAGYCGSCPLTGNACVTGSDCCPGSSCIDGACMVPDPCAAEINAGTPACVGSLAPLPPPPSQAGGSCMVEKNRCYINNPSASTCQILESSLQTCATNLNCENNICVDPCASQIQSGMPLCDLDNSGVGIPPYFTPSGPGGICDTVRKCYYHSGTTCTELSATSFCEDTQCGNNNLCTFASSSSSSSQPMCCNLQTQQCQPI